MTAMKKDQTNNTTNKRRVRFRAKVSKCSYTVDASERQGSSNWYTQKHYYHWRSVALATAGRNRASKMTTEYSTQLLRVYETCLQGNEPDAETLRALARELRKNDGVLRGLESMSTDVIASQMRRRARSIVRAILNSQKLLGGLKNENDRADTLRMISLGRTLASQRFASAMGKVDSLMVTMEDHDPTPSRKQSLTINNDLLNVNGGRCIPSTKLARPHFVCAKHA